MDYLDTFQVICSLFRVTKILEKTYLIICIRILTQVINKIKHAFYNIIE